MGSFLDHIWLILPFPSFTSSCLFFPYKESWIKRWLHFASFFTSFTDLHFPFFTPKIFLIIFTYILFSDFWLVHLSIYHCSFPPHSHPSCVSGLLSWMYFILMFMLLSGHRFNPFCFPSVFSFRLHCFIPYFLYDFHSSFLASIRSFLIQSFPQSFLPDVLPTWLYNVLFSLPS